MPFIRNRTASIQFSKGIFRFNKKTGNYQHFSLPDKDAEAKLASSSAPTNIRVNDRNEIELYGNAFTDIFPEANNLFPSTSRTNNYNILGSILEIPYLSIFHDRNNVFQYNKEKNEYETIAYERNNQILAASIDSLGTLWIAEPNGVTRIHLPSNRKEPLKLPDGNDVITSLVIDHEGIVWMGSLGIIYAYNPHKIILSSTMRWTAYYLTTF